MLKFCKAELLEENYFHAVFEAMKSITAKIRTLSGLSGDGCDLVHDAFGQKYGDPLLAINPFQTETHKGEQYGFMNLLKGLYGTIRNPLAHYPKDRVGHDRTGRPGHPDYDLPGASEAGSGVPAAAMTSLPFTVPVR